MLLLDQAKDGGDAALAQALGRRPSVIAAAAVFPDATQMLDGGDQDPLARLPRAETVLVAAPGLRRSRRGRRRQSHHGQVRHAARRTDAVSDRRQGRIVVPAARRGARDRQRSRSSRLTACGSRATLSRPISTMCCRLLSTAEQGTVRTISAAAVLNGDVDGGIAQGPHRRDRRDRDRRRRRVFHAVRSGACRESSSSRPQPGS